MEKKIQAAEETKTKSEVGVGPLATATEHNSSGKDAFLAKMKMHPRRRVLIYGPSLDIPRSKQEEYAKKFGMNFDNFDKFEILAEIRGKWHAYKYQFHYETSEEKIQEHYDVYEPVQSFLCRDKTDRLFYLSSHGSGACDDREFDSRWPCVVTYLCDLYTRTYFKGLGIDDVMMEEIANHQCLSQPATPAVSKLLAITSSKVTRSPYHKTYCGN